MSRKSNLPRQSLARPSISRPSISRPSTARQSTAAQSKQSLSRQSSVGGIGRASSVGRGLKIDVKANSASNVKYILNYLTENSYPQKLTKKNLVSPTEATFKDVLRFILRDVNPDFEMQRISIAVPELLAFLGYPYMIKESHFKPVGSPHSWPHVLHSMVWLTKFAESAHYESQNVSTLLTYKCQYDDKRQDRELQYITESSRFYKKFNAGDADVDQLILEYKEGCNSEKKCAVLRDGNTELKRKIEALRQAKNDHPAKEEQLQTELSMTLQKLGATKGDVLVFETLKKRAEEEIENKENEIVVQGQKKEEMTEKIERLRSQKALLKCKISQQPPQFEVQKTKQQLRNLLDQRNAVKVEIEERSAEDWKAEIEDSNRQLKFKEDYRQIEGTLKKVAPRHCIRIDKAVDNRTLVQVKATLTDLINKTKISKEESTETEHKLYTDQIKLQELEEDYELLLDNLKSKISQRKYREEDNERKKEKMVRTSSRLDEEVEKSRKRVSELKTALSVSLDVSTIDEKLIEIMASIESEVERDGILQSMLAIKLEEHHAQSAKLEFNSCLVKLIIGRMKF